jgi:hypothetical protein
MGVINGFNVAGAISFVVASASTTSLVETILASQSFYAGTFKSGDIIQIQGSMIRNGGSTNMSLNLYWNTGATTSGAIKIGGVSDTTSIDYLSIHRNIAIVDDNTTLVFPTSSTRFTDLGDAASVELTSALSKLTSINWAVDGFFLMTGQSGNGANLQSNYLTILI